MAAITIYTCIHQIWLLVACSQITNKHIFLQELSKFENSNLSWITFPWNLWFFIIYKYDLSSDFPSGSEIKNLAANPGDPVLIPELGRSPAGGHGNPPVFLPGESHGQRNLAGYSPSGCKVRHNWSNWAQHTARDLSIFKSLSKTLEVNRYFLKYTAIELQILSA